MKRNRSKRMISAGVVIALLASMVGGCGSENKSQQIEPMEAEPSVAVSFDLIGGENVMPQATFYGPYVCGYSEDGQSTPNYMDEYYWEAMAECCLTARILHIILLLR